MTVLKTFGGTFFSLHYGKIGRFIRVIDLLADVGYLDRAIITTDCPRLVLKAVDTVGIAYLIVDIEHEYRAVDIDVYMIDAVGRLREEIAVYIRYEAHGIRSLLLEVHFRSVVRFGVDDDRVITVRPRLFGYGDTEFRLRGARCDGEREVGLFAERGQRERSSSHERGRGLTLLASHLAHKLQDYHLACLRHTTQRWCAIPRYP